MKIASAIVFLVGVANAALDFSQCNKSSLRNLDKTRTDFTTVIGHSPTSGEIRSPCSALNSMANHGVCIARIHCNYMFKDSRTLKNISYIPTTASTRNKI